MSVRRSRRVPAALAAAVLLLAGGCAGSGGKDWADSGLAPLAGPPRPSAHSVRVENLVLKSDTPLAKADPLVADLARLRADVTAALDLPESARDVTVYLFADGAAYRAYLDYAHPGLPDRRAFFVGTGPALHVYTYLGDRGAADVGEDLRHEAVHGLLHAALPGVPLWLDEGLAEYFETPTPGEPNGDYPALLARGVTGGWRPDLERLEGLTDFAALTRRDYAESWAWVHLCMHADRDVLLAHLSSLGPGGRSATPLSARLAAAHAVSPPARLTAHVSGLLCGPTAETAVR